MEDIKDRKLVQKNRQKKDKNQKPKKKVNRERDQRRLRPKILRKEVQE